MKAGSCRAAATECEREMRLQLGRVTLTTQGLEFALMSRERGPAHKESPETSRNRYQLRSGTTSVDAL